VPLAKLFDYAVPDTMQVRAGDRVAVPFGTRQRLGVVVSCSAATDVAQERLKPLAGVRDDAPALPEPWLEFMRFLSSYYQRPFGETVIAALPPRLRSVKPLPRKILKDSLDRTPARELRFVPNHELAPAQSDAVARIDSAAGRFGAMLLHGITGSGKTEVYLHAIARVLQRGLQALVLVPEISLTPQL